MRQFLLLLYRNGFDKCFEESQKAMCADYITSFKCKQNSNPLIDSFSGHMSNCFVDNILTINLESCEAMFF